MSHLRVKCSAESRVVGRLRATWRLELLQQLLALLHMRVQAMAAGLAV